MSGRANARPGRQGLAVNARSGVGSDRYPRLRVARFPGVLYVFPETRTTELARNVGRASRAPFSGTAATPPGYGAEGPGNDVGGRSIRPSVRGKSVRGKGAAFVGLERERREVGRAWRERHARLWPARADAGSETGHGSGGRAWRASARARPPGGPTGRASEATRPAGPATRLAERFRGLGRWGGLGRVPALGTVAGPRPRNQRPAVRSRLAWPLVLAGVVLVVGSGFQIARPMIRSAEAPRGRALPPPVLATTPVRPVASASPLPPPPVVSDPVRLRVPAVAVDAPIVGLGLDAHGAIDVPKQWGDVGWYRPGVPPGAVGPAVLVGHYDSKSGPAVFYRLGSVLPGDQLVVVGASGASVTFLVDRLEEVSKAAFPVQEVYGPVTRPEIRVITCDGAFDEKTHHYVNNLVVYGHAVGVPPGAGTQTPRVAAPAEGAASGPPAARPASGSAASTTAPASGSLPASPPAPTGASAPGTSGSAPGTSGSAPGTSGSMPGTSRTATGAAGGGAGAARDLAGTPRSQPPPAAPATPAAAGTTPGSAPS